MGETTVRLGAISITGNGITYQVNGTVKSITISAERAEQIATELATLRERVAAAENAEGDHDLAYYIEQYAKDKEVISALREQVAKLEGRALQAIREWNTSVKPPFLSEPAIYEICEAIKAATAAGGE